MPEISIHAPRVGSDRFPNSLCWDRELFQSTLPVWGATDQRVITIAREAFQSTLPVWGATLKRLTLMMIRRISIHAPRVGSDVQSASCRADGLGISIHAPRVGSDEV